MDIFILFQCRVMYQKTVIGNKRPEKSIISDRFIYQGNFMHNIFLYSRKKYKV